MIDSLKPYPAMKDSGVPWLGEVPEHWEVQRLRNLADMRVSNVDKHTKDDEQPVRLCNYVDVYKNDYIRPSMSLMRATATKEEIARFRLAEGDVLITKDSEAWNDIGVPALVRESADDLVSGYHLALLRPFRERIAGEFLFRSLQSTGVQYQFHVEANGVTRYGLSHAAIKSVWLSAPPVSEQAAIVRFLDHADRRIRRYILAKQKLIKLLEEQKQAIIHRAVTRGLDPNVRLKPSGVEWLGDVPEHWEVLSFTRIAVERADYRGATPTKTESGIFLVTAKNVRKGWIDYEASKEFVAEKDYAAIMRRGLPKRDDLLLTMEAPLGHAALVDCEDIALAQRIVRFRFDPNRLEATFVLRSVLSPYFQNQLLRRGTGSTALGIKASKLPQLQLLVPPLAEQRTLLQWIDRECRPIDFAAGQAESEIALLREYRTRLIADVVTGKLDVREAAARLPQEAEDLEPLDENEVEGETEENEAGDGVPEEAEA